MRKILFIASILISTTAFAQAPNTDAVFKTVKAKSSITLGLKKITSITNDTTVVDSSALWTSQAVRNFIVARVVSGGSLIPNFPLTISGDTITINYADRVNDGVIPAFAYAKFEDDSSKFQISGSGYRTKGDKKIGIGMAASSTYWIDINGTFRSGGDALINGVTVGRGTSPSTDNTVLGYEALLNNTSNHLVAVGYQALKASTGGYENVAIGYQAGYQLGSALENVLIGPYSMWSSTGAPSRNVAVGKTSLRYVTGSDNVAIGRHAGLMITSGSNNIMIGSGADAPVVTADAQLNIGGWIYGRGGKIGINTTDSSERFVINGNLKLLTAGNKIFIATGSNASMGTATLSGGTITVSTTAVTTSSKIFISYSGTLTNPGYISTANIVNGTSFDIVSSSGTDGSSVNWWIIN